MKQKSFLWSIFAMMMVSMLIVGLSACSDDDDDGIVGTWIAYDGDEDIILTFNSDQTGIIKEKNKLVASFTYSMTNSNSGTMNIKVNSSYSKSYYEVWTFNVKGSSLYLYYDDDVLIFTKQGKDSDITSNIVGTWSGKDGKDQLTLTFNKDGSGSWISRYYDSYSGTETERGTFTYEMKGKSSGVMTIRTYDSYSGYHTENLYIEIEGKTMYLYEEINRYGLIWILTKE